MRRCLEISRRPARAAVWSAVLALAMGCGGPDGPPLRLELPRAGAHRSAVVVVGSPSDGALVARDLASSAEPLVVSWPEQGDLQITALLYEEALDQLGLASGALERLGPTEGEPLPEPLSVLQASTGPDIGASWQPIAAPPEELAAVRVERRARCAPFRIEAIELPSDEDIALVSAASIGGAVLVGEGGTLWQVTKSGGIFELARGLPSGASFTGADGGLWLGGSGGRLVRVDLQPGPVAALSSEERVPGAARILALAGAPGDLSPRVVLDDDQRLFGGGPGAWAELVHVGDDLGEVAGIVAPTPETALFGFEDSIRGYRWTGGELLEEDIRASAFDVGVSALGYWPGVGTVIGTEAGELVQQAEGDDTWIGLQGEYATIPVRSLDIYEEGFVYADDRGVVVQFVPDTGFCLERPPPPGFDVSAREMAVVGDDIVTAGEAGDAGRPNVLFWYHREGP